MYDKNLEKEYYQICEERGYLKSMAIKPYKKKIKISAL